MRNSANSKRVLDLVTKIMAEHSIIDRAKLTNQFLDEMTKLSEEELTAMTAHMASYPENPGAVNKALREALLSHLSSKNSQKLTASIEKLDRSTFWLTIMLIVLSVVGLLVALVPEHVKEAIFHV